MDYAARFLCVCICITCTRPICFCIFSITWNAVRYHTPCAMHVRVSVCVCVPIVCCIHVGHRRSRTGTNTSHTHSSFHIHKVQVANARAHALRPLYLAPNCVCARAYNSGHHWRGGSQKLIRIYHKHNNKWSGSSQSLSQLRQVQSLSESCFQTSTDSSVCATGAPHFYWFDLIYFVFLFV